MFSSTTNPLQSFRRLFQRRHRPAAIYRLHGLDQVGNCDQLVPVRLERRNQLLQHRHRPLPSIVADDNRARMRHALDMLRIDVWVRQLRIVRIHAAQGNPEPPVTQQVSHAAVEEARARAEVVIRQDLVLGRVRGHKLLLYLVDLLLELVVGELVARLVVHGVVAELVACRDELAQDLGALGTIAVHLAADDEEGRVDLVLEQHLGDVAGVRGRGVVKRQRHHALLDAGLFE